MKKHRFTYSEEEPYLRRARTRIEKKTNGRSKNNVLYFLIAVLPFALIAFAAGVIAFISLLDWPYIHGKIPEIPHGVNVGKDCEEDSLIFFKHASTFNKAYRNVLMHERNHIITNIMFSDAIGYKRVYYSISKRVNDEHGVALVVHKKIDTNQGERRYTGGVLSVAIMGRGYFQVTDALGRMVYTRNGAFTVDDKRRLANDIGVLYPPLVIPEGASSDIRVEEDGSVKVFIPAHKAYSQIGTLALYEFTLPGSTQLTEDGGVMSTVTNNVYACEKGAYVFTHKFVEISNVDIEKELDRWEENITKRKKLFNKSILIRPLFEEEEAVIKRIRTVVRVSRMPNSDRIAVLENWIALREQLQGIINYRKL